MNHENLLLFCIINNNIRSLTDTKIYKNEMYLLINKLILCFLSIKTYAYYSGPMQNIEVKGSKYQFRL